jgi:hypothetical protein
MPQLSNFATSLVATAPAPATSGTSLIVTATEGTLFPATPFYATLAPNNVLAVQGATPNSEVVQVTTVSTDTLTIVRAQLGTSAQTVAIGWRITATVYAEHLNFGFYNVKTYGAVGNGVTNDAVAIQSAINAASTAGGGTVYLPQGTYKVVSAARTDATVSYTGTLTWTDSHILTADNGSYIIGVGVSGRAPHITGVTNGVGFTTDIAPGGTITAGTVTVVAPALVVPDGVSLEGAGGTYGALGATTGGSIIYDSGTGITVFLRGGNNTGGYFGRNQFESLTIWGSATGATVGSTLAGLWINNNLSFVEIESCDISGHGTWGFASDYNCNTMSVRNTLFSYDGAVGASVSGGGVCLGPFNEYETADLAFYNCYWFNNYGFGLTGVASGTPGGVTLYSCQFSSTIATSFYQSGTACFLGDASGAINTIINCEIESSGLYDVAVIYGACTIVSSTLYSSSAYSIYANNSTVNLQGVLSNNHATATVNANASTITYSGCLISDPTFLAGQITAAQASGVGAIGSPLMTNLPISLNNAVTVTTNAGTCSSAYELNTFTNTSAATMAITIAVATPTPIDGQQMIVRIYDFSAATQTIGWTNTENSTISAPTTSSGSTTLPLSVGFIYNGKTSKWRCVAVS